MVRVRKNLGLAEANGFRASSATLLAISVIDYAHAAWMGSCQQTPMDDADSRYVFRGAPSVLFGEMVIPRLPKPNDLLALLCQERAAAHVVIRDRASDKDRSERQDGADATPGDLEDARSTVVDKLVRARSWPNPSKHTTAKVWTVKGGAIRMSAKTDGQEDSSVEFAPDQSGKSTCQMRFIQCLCFRYPQAATLGELIEQVYPVEFAAAARDGDAQKKLLRKFRTLVSDVRIRKFQKAGMNPDILPSLSVEASINAGITLRLAKLHPLDDKELDEADKAPG